MMRRSSGMHLLTFACSSVLFSCGVRTVEPWHGADASTWSSIRRALQARRDARPRDPWTAAVRMTMQDSRVGRTVDGRGAMAVAPGRALRMILVGAAGATMLDAWVTGGRWRVAVPVLGLVRRGGAEDPAGLPVGFLRWSFFRPLAGTLLAASTRGGKLAVLLRDGDDVVDVRFSACNLGELTETTRRSGERSERVEECRSRMTPSSGDWVRYEDTTRGLRVDMVLESVSEAPPDDEAFRDPDGPLDRP